MFLNKKVEQQYVDQEDKSDISSEIFPYQLYIWFCAIQPSVSTGIVRIGYNGFGIDANRLNTLPFRYVCAFYAAAEYYKAIAKGDEILK